MTRYVALDLETTGLDPRFAQPVEIAAVELTGLDDPEALYGKVMSFVPYHPRETVNNASQVSLAVNRYYERRLFEKMLTPRETDQCVAELVDLLTGATLVGANPAYDAAILWPWLSAHAPEIEAPPWDFRLYDVELATAVHADLDAIPSLRSCCKRFEVSNNAAHTALGDAYAAADVFYALRTGHAPVDESPAVPVTFPTPLDMFVKRRRCTCPHNAAPLDPSIGPCAVHGSGEL